MLRVGKTYILAIISDDLSLKTFIRLRFRRSSGYAHLTLSCAVEYRGR